MSFGVDVAAYRSDDLDKKVLAFVSEQSALGQQPNVLDLGSGSGGLAARLAAAGAQVTAVDAIDYAVAIDEHNLSLPSTCAHITFVQKDMTSYIKSCAERYDAVVLQRALHYVPHLEAVEMLRTIRRVSQRAYLSVTGCESDIGNAYPLTAAPLFERFGYVATPVARRFGITAPICLYSAAEFAELIENTGWGIEYAWTSLFGNHKAVISTA